MKTHGYGYLDKKEKLLVSIFNTEGKMIRREFLQLPAGNYSRSLPIEELANGLYTLQVTGTVSGERQEIKFIKKR